MAITHVAGQSGRGTTYSGTSISVTMAATPTAGNVLVAAIGLNSASRGDLCVVSSITQTNVTWTAQVVSSSVRDAEIWLGVVAASASTSVTINLTESPAYCSVADIYEYSGVATSGFLDKTAVAAGVTYSEADQTLPTGTTDTTTQADELWIGAIMNSKNSSSAANGFTLYDGEVAYGAVSISFLEKIVSATGTASSGAFYVITGYAQPWQGAIATFKGASSGIQKFCLINEMGY